MSEPAIQPSAEAVQLPDIRSSSSSRNSPMSSNFR